MKKKLIMIALGLLVAGAVNAQEYKVAKSTGKLMIIEVGDVHVEGHDGKEVIFTSRDHKRERDERAQGLRAVSSMGLEDNTGLGLAVTEKGDVIEVRQLKKMDGPDVTIKVPKGMTVSYQHSSPHGNDFHLRNLDNPVQVSTVHNQVRLDNVTGRVEVKTVHGDIDAVFANNPTESIVLESVHGHVDIAIPATAKASLKLDTSWGELFIDPQLKIEVDNKGELVRYSDSFSGKINGGGVNIDLSSKHNNVYLRKK